MIKVFLKKEGDGVTCMQKRQIEIEIQAKNEMYTKVQEGKG